MSLRFAVRLVCLLTVVLTDISQFESNYNILDNGMVLLRELHAAFCGEDFLCKNDSSYWQTSGDLVIPKPCCIPCSCSLTCGNRSDCCPAFWKNGTVHDTRLEASGTTSEYMANQNDTTDDAIARAEETPGGIFEDSDTNSLPFMTSCMRPQVFYRPNHVLDSEAYEMVATCPKRFKDVATIEKCHAGLGKAERSDAEMYNKNLVDMIPVTSILTGLTYANKYCSYCNGVSANATSKFRDWQPALVGFGADRDFLRPELIVEQTARYWRGFDNIHFIPEKAIATAKCNAYDIQFCNQTGLLNTKNETMLNACLNGPGLTIIHSVGGKRLSFKNIACLHCNMGNDFTGDLNSCGYYKTHGGQQRYMTSMSFHLQSTVSNEQRESSLRVSYLGESSLRLLKQGLCPPGYAALQGTCREVICPRHHYLRQNQCVPLFDTLSELDIHVRVQVTPDRVITKDIAAEFEGKLKDMVNSILKERVSLKVREMFVMYLPDKNRNGKMYYLYDIHLYNTTVKIRFSQVIGDIKGLFREMKTHSLSILSNGMKIGLKIDFAHKIKIQPPGSIMDLSNGKSLTLANKTAWMKGIRRPDYEITNVHWCYRIGFSLSEVKPLVLWRVYVIPSNPPVTVYETEIELDRINRKIYICIDLVVAPTARAEKGQTVTDKENLDITVDDTNEALDRGAALVGTCLVIALLGFIFYKVRAHVRDAKTNTDVLVPRSQSLIELDTINIQSEQNYDQSEQRKSDQPKQRKNDHSHQRMGVHFDPRIDGHFQRKYVQSEQRNGGQSEQGQNGQSEKRKDGECDQRSDGQPEQEKEGQFEQGNDGRSEQRKDGQCEQRKDGQSEQRKDGMSKQIKDGQSEQRNDGQSEQGKNGQPELRKNGQSEQRKDGQSEQGKDGQSQQGNDGLSEQGNDGLSEQGKDGQSEQKDGQSEQKNDGQSEQGYDGQSEQRKDGQSEQGKDRQSVQRKDGQTGQGMDGRFGQRKNDGKSEQRRNGKSEQRQDGQSRQRNDGQSGQSKDGQSEQRKDGQCEQIKDGQSEQKKDGQSELRKDGQSAQIDDGQSEQGFDCLSKQRNDGQSEQGNDGLSGQGKDSQSEQGKDCQSEQGNDGLSEQGKDGQSEQGNDGLSGQRNDGLSEQGNDGLSEQGKDGLSEQGNDGLSEQGYDGQSEQGKDGQSEQGKDGQSGQGKDGQSEQGNDGLSEQGKDGQSEPGKAGQSAQRKDD